MTPTTDHSSGGDGTAFEPIAAYSLQAAVFERLRRTILDGTFQPGDRLVERELADMLRVSKTPVREAMQELARRGLLTRRANRGMEVRTVTLDLVREIYQARSVLEPEALRLAVPFHTSDSRAALRETLRHAAEAGARDDLADLASMNRRFHTLLNDPCPNRLICSMIDDLSDQVALITVAGWRQEATWRPEAREHEAIIDALDTGDGDEAARRLKSHIRRAHANLVETLGADGATLKAEDAAPEHDGAPAHDAAIPSEASHRR